MTTKPHDSEQGPGKTDVTTMAHSTGLSSTNEEETNPYLLMRQAKIARNRARLAELGLLREQTPLVFPRRNIRNVNAPMPRSSKKKTTTVAVPTRRSSRIASSRKSGKIDYRDPPESLAKRKRNNGEKSINATACHVAEENICINSGSADGSFTTGSSSSSSPNGNAPSISTTLTKPTVRTTPINVAAIVRGIAVERTNVKSNRNIDPNSNNGSPLLGKPIDSTGKARVMYHSVHMSYLAQKSKASSPPPPPTTTTTTTTTGANVNENAWEQTELYALAISNQLSFNKYSGVQEWYNDALFLWVNIGGGGTSANASSGIITNDFLDGGKRMTWFGGSRMHDDSPIINRLISVGKRASAGTLHPSDGIVLWCRLYDSDKRSFGPYVCLGRLGYHSHVPGTRPIQFVWTLLDYDELMRKCNMNDINEVLSPLFRDIVKY